MPQAAPDIRRIARQLGPRDVHIWHLQLGTSADMSTAGLSIEERRRAARMVDRQQRRIYVLVHQALRPILAAYLDVKPAQVNFRKRATGKPELFGSPAARQLHFNISHSGSRAVVAVTRSAEIGVDVERMRPNARLDAVVRRFFAIEERESLAAIDPIAFRKAAYKLWVLKEAYVKATGDGLGRRLDSFALDWRGLQPKVLRCENGRPDQWALRCFAATPDYSVALAVNHGHVLVDHFHVRHQRAGQFALGRIGI